MKCAGCVCGGGGGGGEYECVCVCRVDGGSIGGRGGSDDVADLSCVVVVVYMCVCGGCVCRGSVCVVVCHVATSGCMCVCVCVCVCVCALG